MAKSPKPSFIGPPQEGDEKLRRLRSWQRPWVVCAYAPLGAQFDKPAGRWLIPAQQWQEVTVWKLIDFKIFESRDAAFASSSYGRRYAPFNHSQVLVLLRRNRTIRVDSLLGTVRLYKATRT